MQRRIFLRTLSLAVVGGVFVPKYERWFRPLARGDSWYAAILDAHTGEVIYRLPLYPTPVGASVAGLTPVFPEPRLIRAEIRGPGVVTPVTWGYHIESAVVTGDQVRIAGVVPRTGNPGLRYTGWQRLSGLTFTRT